MKQKDFKRLQKSMKQGLEIVMKTKLHKAISKLSKHKYRCAFTITPRTGATYE